MSNPLVIGFGFTARCGKDFAVKQVLAAYPETAQRVAFADALKSDLDQWLQQHLGISAWTEDPSEKEIIRPILVAYGEARRKQDPLCWVKRAYNRLDPIREIICISDVRYPNEARAIKERGGYIVNIAVSGFVPFVNESEKLNAPACVRMADYMVENCMSPNFVQKVLDIVADARLRFMARNARIQTGA